MPFGGGLPCLPVETSPFISEKKPHICDRAHIFPFFIFFPTPSPLACKGGEHYRFCTILTEMGCFFWVNTILGNLKTAIAGTYHAFKFQQYAHRYLAEAQYRFNRRFDLRSMLPRLLYAGVMTGKRIEVWLRLAEDYR